MYPAICTDKLLEFFPRRTHRDVTVDGVKDVLFSGVMTDTKRKKKAVSTLRRSAKSSTAGLFRHLISEQISVISLDIITVAQCKVKLLMDFLRASCEPH